VSYISISYVNTQGSPDFSQEFLSCNVHMTICSFVRNHYSHQYSKIGMVITLHNFSWVFRLICLLKSATHTQLNWPILLC